MAPNSKFDLRAIGQTVETFGGGPWSFATDLLSAPDFGGGIAEISIVIFANGPPTRKALAGLAPLNMTPSVKFLKKNKELVVEFPTRHFDRRGLRSYYLKRFNSQDYTHAMDDVIAALTWAFDKSKDRFSNYDSDALLEWLETQRETPFETDEALQQAVDAAMERARAARDAADHWDLLAIDWEKMHPSAKSILDQPDDWSESHEFTPHGNDTGADIFADWDTYSRLSPNEAALRLGWQTSEMDENNDLFWSDWVKIHLGLAFGHLKVSGTCGRDLARRVITVLEQDITGQKKNKQWEHLEDYVTRMERYRSILTRFKG